MSLQQQKMALQALTLMDLTSLNDHDTEQTIINLCHQAHNKAGDTAAICIYPQFIPIAKKTLQTLNAQHIKIATVANFPDGSGDIERAVTETKKALQLGADEIDVVFPYHALIAGDGDIGSKLVRACKNACGEKAKLKVIIESGVLKTDDLIKKASQISIEAGADFIKTSTGKVTVNATLTSAEIMLNVIKTDGGTVGFKAAGGIRNVADATAYLTLCQTMMGDAWLTPQHFRFGASSLLSDVLKHLKIDTRSVKNL